ncbi:MAG: glycosyltransferase family 39 protein [Steroidobacteraceae bacterium]
MQSPPDDRWSWRDVGAILLLLLLLVASGYGLRDPWPADEPRFASLARDMALSGDWLFPRVGGDLYQDKPPFYFWLLAASWSLLGSVRASFLLPSMLAAAVTLLLVYDLGRRLHGRRAGLAAALLLGSTLQFVQTMRGAQIDPTLLGVSTTALYLLARHLLLGPAPRLLAAGGFAAGIGVITKGVGFLPLLLLPLAALLRRGAGFPFASGARAAQGSWRALAGFMIGAGVWVVPMLLAVASSASPELAAYRDEILFQQTVKRYAGAWHHLQPWYFFLVDVVPLLWLPASLLLFWLVPRWRDDWRERRSASWLLLAWVLAVLLFFSASPGKRGVYLLPALPALALAAAPHLPLLLARRGVVRTGFGLAALLALAGWVVFAAAQLGEPRIATLLAEAGPAATAVVGMYALLATAALLWCAWRAPLLAWPAVLACLTVAFGLGIAPAINPARSGEAFVRGALATAPAGAELGLVAYKEQFLLYLDRDTVNFGHSRWREGGQESYDAAAWLAAAPGRALLVPGTLLRPCFGTTRNSPAGDRGEEPWWWVQGEPDMTCVRHGDRHRAISYGPRPVR